MLAMRYATKMHFRTRQNVIQLIRTTYESEKKRGVNSIVGTVPLSKPVLSAELQGQLTSQEAEAFDAWLQTEWRTQQLRLELAALSLPETLELAADWFEQNAESLSARALAEEVAKQMQTLRRKLKTKGLLD